DPTVLKAMVVTFDDEAAVRDAEVARDSLAELGQVGGARPLHADGAERATQAGVLPVRAEEEAELLVQDLAVAVRRRREEEVSVVHLVASVEPASTALQE